MLGVADVSLDGLNAFTFACVFDGDAVGKAVLRASGIGGQVGELEGCVRKSEAERKLRRHVVRRIVSIPHL